MAMGVLVMVTMVVVTVTIIGHMATVGTTFGFKRQICFYYRHVHAAQHVGQNMVRFDFQVVGLQLNRNMPIAKVIGSAHQIEGSAMLGAGCDLEDFLRSGNDPHHGAVFCHQYIAAAHGLAMWEKNGQSTALAISGGKP